jgi:hypothetical protein
LRKNSSDGGGPGPVFRSIAVAHIEQKTIARIFCFVTFQGYRDFFKRSFKLSAIMTGMRSPDFFRQLNHIRTCSPVYKNLIINAALIVDTCPVLIGANSV